MGEMINIVREDLSEFLTLRSHGVCVGGAPEVLTEAEEGKCKGPGGHSKLGGRQKETLLDAPQRAHMEAEDGTIGVEYGESRDREPQRWTGRTWIIMVT